MAWAGAAMTNSACGAYSISTISEKPLSGFHRGIFCWGGGGGGGWANLSAWWMRSKHANLGGSEGMPPGFF